MILAGGDVRGAWARAGLGGGFAFGAVFGAMVTLVGGLGAVFWFGAMIGGVIGAISGVAVGVVNRRQSADRSRVEPEGCYSSDPTNASRPTMAMP